MTADAYDGLAFVDEGGSSLEVGGRTFGADDLLPLIFAPPGDVEGPVVAIDWNPAATAADGKGCAVTHYGDLPANAIVVVRSGDCLRRDQVIAAQQAGAAAFVAVYPWAPPRRRLPPHPHRAAVPGDPGGRGLAGGGRSARRRGRGRARRPTS